MMTRPLLDEAKALAEKRTGIPANRMLISATHAHSAPASMGCLGTDPDPAYVPFLRDKLVEAIAAAQAALEPARIGFAKGRRRGFHRGAPMDPPARSHRGGSVWKHDGARQHARRPELGRRHRRGRPGRSRSLAHLDPGARRPPARGAGEFLDALLRRQGHQRGLLRPLLRGLEAAPRARVRAGQAGIRRHHVARLQRRHLPRGLQDPGEGPAEADDRSNTRTACSTSR